MLISKFDNGNIDFYIKEFEGTYDIILPEAYKKFLLKYNGGKTPETEFRMNGISSDIQGFYGFGKASSHYHFDGLKKSVKWEEWLNDKMLPIASNVFGDYIMMSINVENKGRIYFYYHDRASKYIELAEDFLTFIKKCKSKKIGHIRTIEERKEDMIRLGKGDKITPEKVNGWQTEINEYADIHQEELLLF